ncbi:MAG TPA: hypothetical protein ENJ13_10355 [Chromatiales bacterium]|nr:hypothetical protein [Chromatiales bacterium]
MNEILFHPLGDAVSASEDLEKIADIDPRLMRTHYFDGQLLTAEDLTRDQIYLDQRLREVGRVLGNGILSGLALSLDSLSGMLTLDKGKALTSAGRVLELGRTLSVSLHDKALISQLNSGLYQRFNRGLYAVVLRYVDVGTDIAEVFPKDLGDKRGFEYALVTESVQMGLVPLPTALAQQHPLHVRANLMREYLGDDQLHGVLPEDAVALGVLAIKEDSPQWLDTELLRHPVRNEADKNELQADLMRQYEKLLADVLAARRGGGLTGDFSARDYFSLLPPVGTIPMEAVDPVNGRQGYFPENFQVSIAPVRQSDVALIKEEALGQPPIDLSSKEPVDIVILAPLSNQEYGQFARQLETNYDPTLRRLPQLDLLRLRLYPTQLDLDTSAWTTIWDRVKEEEIFYQRRPTRAAETQISAIVLAQGSTLPPSIPPVSSPADSGNLLESEEQVFFRRISFKQLANERSPQDDEGNDSLEEINLEFRNDAAIVMACLNLLLVIDSRYDSLIWQTLLHLARGGNLADFLVALKNEDTTSGMGQRVAGVGVSFGLPATLLNRWRSLDA